MVEQNLENADNENALTTSRKTPRKRYVEEAATTFSFWLLGNLAVWHLFHEFLERFKNQAFSEVKISPYHFLAFLSRREIWI